MHTPRNIQSPYTATDFWDQWSSINPRMALFIKVTSKAEFGSEVVAFTSNSRNMTLPGHVGITFYSSPAMTPTVIEQGLDEAANMEFTGGYNADSFTQADVRAGKWNFATIEVFSACWHDDSATGGIDRRKYGELVHFKGNVGEFRDCQTYFTVEARGIIARLSNEVKRDTSRFCYAPELGDTTYCKKDLSGTVTISSVVYNIKQVSVFIDGSYTAGDLYFTAISTFFAGNLPPADFFNNGKMTVQTGDNAGISREIARSFDSSGGTMEFQLKRGFPFAFVGTELITLVAGCTKTLEDCIKFDNIINRRAEDWIPGFETINRISQT